MNKDFLDILKAQIQKQEREIESPLFQEPPSTQDIKSDLLFLELVLQTKAFSFPKNPYQAHTGKSRESSSSHHQVHKKTTPHREVLGQIPESPLSTEIRLFLSQWNQKLPQVLSKKDLKRIFRKMAFHLHPDSTTGNHEAFLRLKPYFTYLEQNWRELEDHSQAA